MPARGFVLMVLLLLPAAAVARPEHKATLKRYYGPLLAKSLFACATCHEVATGADEIKLAEEAPPHNAFGVRLSRLGEELQAQGQPFDLMTRLKLVADEDADADGAANEIELLAGHAPGNPADVLSKDELAAATVKREQFQKQYRWDPWGLVHRPAVPKVKNTAWVRNPIDAFLAAEHEARGLQPRPEAPRHVLLRRAYVDLVGLPPTREELRAFLADESPEAYENVIERLLASPQYGERWGRHWMDVWRYSDWAGWGQQVRDSQPHIWRWRDWIVEALNRDLPYDQMIVDMLAADEAHPGDLDSLRATGFLVRNFKLLSREQWMQDVVDHTTLAFLGTTVKCARCHDHMYDPLAQREYYQLRAIFEPHQVRLDRVAGQLDTAQDGLARVFDADAAVQTFLYHRGDERTPDKERPISPGVPAHLGGPKFLVEPVELPTTAYSPEKLPFVIADLLQASESAVAAAKTKLEEARKKAGDAKAAVDSKSEKPEAEQLKLTQAHLAAARELAAAELEAPLASARHASLQTTLQVEQLEDSGEQANNPATWEAAALAANKAQTALAQLEAEKALLVAKQAVEKAASTFEEAESKSSKDPDKADLKKGLEKATADKVTAEKKLAEAETQSAKAKEAAALPANTTYTKRTVKTYPTTSTGRRLALARWIAHRENPLTARVAVNHIWLRHFGQALVESVFDFGQNGRPPLHPALVDWLAAEFMAPSETNPQSAIRIPHSSPWSMKHIHRLILTSAAYRMNSTSDATAVASDPDNRFLWHFPSRRMEGEVVRDSLLYVANQLDLTRGGKDLDCKDGLTSKRRSLYFRHAAEKQMTLLKLFDAPAVNECYERKESIVPQQALALANSELTIVQSRLLARRLAESNAEAQEFVAAAFEQVLARPANGDEIAECLAFLAEQEKLFAGNASRLGAGTSKLSDGSKPSSEPALRARENLVHVLMNHHDFVTVR